MPSNGLQKLNDKKVVSIILDIKIQNSGEYEDFLVIRDRFDWDLGEAYMRPSVFADLLTAQLNIYNDA